MIPHGTVLILGAGASAPYSFPTGRQLTNLILERNEDAALLENMGFSTAAFTDGSTLYPNSPETIFRQYHIFLEKRLDDHGISKGSLQLFQEQFRLSQSYSVDSFVADNPSYKELASLMVACILLRCEQKETLAGDWYQFLFNELISEGINFPADTLSVVTFNYDRSLERYLFQAFCHRYNLTQAQAWERVQRIKIIHVYGSLGPLFNEQGLTELSYGNNGAMGAAAQNIKLVTPRAEPVQAEAIHDLLQRATTTIFLGFGFDALNLAAVQIPSSAKRVFSSCYKLSRVAIERAEIGLLKKYSASPHAYGPGKWIKWGEKTLDVAGFLDNSEALV